MNNLKYYFSAFTLIASTITFFTIKSDYGWLLFNSSQAEELAINLLKNNPSPTHEWTYDLLIVKNEKFVTFTKHHSLVAYAYSKKEVPVKEPYKWSHAWGNWYIGKIKT